MSKKSKPKSGPACELVACEDKDGNVVIRPKGKCPPGYVQKIATRIKSHGLIVEYSTDDEASSDASERDGEKSGE